MAMVAFQSAVPAAELHSPVSRRFSICQRESTMLTATCLAWAVQSKHLSSETCALTVSGLKTPLTPPKWIVTRRRCCFDHEQEHLDRTIA